MKILRSGRVRTIGLLAALLTLILPLAACGGDQEGEVTTIRFQSYAGAVDALLLADALGHLDGLKLEKVGDTTGGPMSLQALVSRQTDIGASAFYGAIAQLVATGAPIKAVAPAYGSTNGLNSKLAVRADSSITSARDLIGKKVAVNTLGANNEAILDTWFEKEGLSKEEQDEVTLVVLPSLNTPKALEEGQVDAAFLSFLSYQHAARTMDLETIVTDVDVVGEYIGGGYTLRDDFLEKNPTTSKTLIEGIYKAVNFIETHEKQEIFDVYFPYLEKQGLDDYIEAIEANFQGTLGVPAESQIEDKDIELWLGWLESRGDVEGGKITASDVYTNEYNPYAK